MALPTPPDDSAQASLYRSYADGSTYKFEPGVVVVPRVGNTPRAIRVHQPYSKRVRKVRATKDRQPPVINAPATTDTVLSQEITYPLPVVTTGNPPVFQYTIDATYVTLETGQLTPIDSGIVGGRYPMTFPLLDQAAAAVGGFAATPLILEPPFSTGAWAWPFISLSHAFFARDPAASQ